MAHATPLFAWGRSGGPTAKSGWSMAQQNFQSGFTEVFNGTGDMENGISQSGGYQEGIIHNNDTIEAITYQYNVWGYDTADGLYDAYLGHCPRDSELGLNFSVFARPKIVSESVAGSVPSSCASLEVLLIPERIRRRLPTTCFHHFVTPKSRCLMTSGPFSGQHCRMSLPIRAGTKCHCQSTLWQAASIFAGLVARNYRLRNPFRL